MRLLKEIRSLMENYHLKSGIYHYYRNELKQAAEHLRRALEGQPPLSGSERRAALYYLTQTHVSAAERAAARGELDEAARALEEALRVSPTYPDIHYRYGRVLERLGRTEEALAALRGALRLHPGYLEAQVSLGFTLLGAGRAEEAEAAFRHALAIKLRQVREPAERGLAALRAGQLAEATEALRETFLSARAKFEEHYRQGLARLKAEEYEEAIAHLEQAIALRPKFSDLHNFRGVALYAVGRVEEAIEAFSRALELNPDYIFPRLNLAFALVRVGEYKLAEAELEAVLARDGTIHAARVKLEELRTGRALEARRQAGRGEPR